MCLLVLLGSKLHWTIPVGPNYPSSDELHLCVESANEKSATALHEHRFLGNEALHELVIPSGTDLVLANEIMENLLETLFEVPEKANMLKYSRAVRKMNKGA